MRTRTIMMTALIGCSALGVAGCSSGAAPAASSTSSLVATSPAPAPGAGVFGVTQSAACETDLQLLETQVNAYLALNGGSEATEDGIVAEGLGRAPSTLHDIGPGASIVPAVGSGCAR